MKLPVWPHSVADWLGLIAVLLSSQCIKVALKMETGCEWSQIWSPSSTQSRGNEIAISLHTVAIILVMSPSPSSIFPCMTVSLETLYFFKYSTFKYFFKYLAQPYYKPLLPTFCLHKISQSTFSSLSSSHHLYLMNILGKFYRIKTLSSVTRCILDCHYSGRWNASKIIPLVHSVDLFPLVLYIISHSE